MIQYLAQGIVLGFVSGISPGPLLGLLISQTIRGGWRAGIRTALAPLLTDIPLIVLFVFVLSHMPTIILHGMSIVGGLFVIYLGYETIQDGRKNTKERTEVGSVEVQARSEHILLKAATTNLLNPHPYLFWATVGSTLLLQSFATCGISASAGFLVGFYALLIGVKMVMVLLLSWGRNWLQGKTYSRLLIASGLLLIGLGFLLLWEGCQAFLYR